MLVSLAIFVGVFVYVETTALRRDFDLPVGQHLIADLRRGLAPSSADPTGCVELAYANFRNLDRVGPVMCLEDGTGDQDLLPSALFSPEAEAWFRQPRPSSRLCRGAAAAGMERDRARAGPRPEARSCRSAAGSSSGHGRGRSRSCCSATPRWASTCRPWFAALRRRVPRPALRGRPSAREYSVLRKRLDFRFGESGCPCRVRRATLGSSTPSNFRERIDPAAVTFFERRKGLRVPPPHDRGGEALPRLPGAMAGRTAVAPRAATVDAI